MSRLRFDFWTMTTHNRWRLPRVGHHLSHTFVGLIVGAPLLLLGLSDFKFIHRYAWVIALIGGTLLAFADKSQWDDWGEDYHLTVHWKRFGFGNTLDFISDLGLTLIGAFLYAWMFDWMGWCIASALVLILGIFNGQ